MLFGYACLALDAIKAAAIYKQIIRRIESQYVCVCVCALLSVWLYGVLARVCVCRMVLTMRRWWCIPPIRMKLCKLWAIKSTTTTSAKSTWTYILEKTEQMIHVICKLNAINWWDHAQCQLNRGIFSGERKSKAKTMWRPHTCEIC